LKKVLSLFLLLITPFPAFYAFSEQAEAAEPVGTAEVSEAAESVGTAEVSEKAEEIPYIEVFSEGVSLDEVHAILENYTGHINISSTSKILENSIEYRAYVRKRLKESEMPSCLEYLPIIESDYKPTAKPPKGTSMGIWQFMPNSVSPYMELSEYVDERRDPWISTEGALKKLSENYRQFGDWLLALAAYNCGAGAVKRALEKAKVKTYTGLCEENLIPDHAKVYVKRFLALSDTIINAGYYGFERLSEADYIEEIADGEYFFYSDFDYVTVTCSIGLDVLAMELKMDYDILHSLNLSLVKGITPPDREYKIRLPKGMKAACTEAVVNLLTKQFLNKD